MHLDRQSSHTLGIKSFTFCLEPHK